MRTRRKTLITLQDALIEECKQYGPGTPEYKKALKQILLIDDHLLSRKQPWLSPETVLTNVVFLGTAFLLMRFEQQHAFTGKSFGLLRSPRT